MFSLKMIAVAALAIAMLGVSPAVAQQGPKDRGDGGTGGVFEFAGFSSATTNGRAGGWPGMYQLCQADFGVTARMCNLTEYFLSPGVLYPAVAAWINDSETPAYRGGVTCLGRLIDEESQPTGDWYESRPFAFPGGLSFAEQQSPLTETGSPHFAAISFPSPAAPAELGHS